MKSRVSGPLVLVLALVASAGHIQAAEPPRQIVDSMIAAHGGMEKWTSAPTVSFEVEMVPAGATGRDGLACDGRAGPAPAYHEAPALSARMA